MPDFAAYARMLDSGHLLRRSVMESLIGLLEISSGQRILDAGCGTGLVSAMLARQVGARGLVAGLDISRDLVKLGPVNAAQADVAERVTFARGDARRLPFADRSFDVVLSVDCAGYPASSREAMVGQLREFARVLRPGGRAVLAAWSSQRLLPGYPELEARLNLTRQGLAPYGRSLEPGAHFDRATGWFREAGYGETTMHVLAESVLAPLSRERRTAMLDLFYMRWAGSLGELGRKWRVGYEALTRSDSKECILDEPDYAAFFTYTVFVGSRAPDL